MSGVDLIIAKISDYSVCNPKTISWK